MSSWYDQAKEKLEKERRSGRYDRYAQIMKDRICEKLLFFCQQDEEFSQAVVQGGTFEACMAVVAKEAAKYGGAGLPDEDAYGHAVNFYFPGAVVHMSLTIDLCGSVREDDPEDDRLIRLDFSALFS